MSIIFRDNNIKLEQGFSMNQIFWELSLGGNILIIQDKEVARLLSLLAQANAYQERTRIIETEE